MVCWSRYKSDYEADSFGIYLALAVHENLPVDMLEEDSLVASALAQYLYTMRVELTGHFKSRMTEIYLHI